MTSVDTLLHEFRSVSPGSPKLTWYGPDGERIELSGKVLDNWVAKTANFLTEEFDVASSSLVTLQLPAHWKSLCIVLAGLACGSTVRSAETAEPGSQASVWFAADDAAVDAAAAQLDTVAVALPALAMAWPSELPDEVHDYAAEVRMFADAFTRFDEPEIDDPALETPDWSLSYAELASLAKLWEQAAGAQPARVALYASAGLAATAKAALGIWQAGGSVVLFADPALADAQILQTEQVSQPAPQG